MGIVYVQKPSNEPEKSCPSLSLCCSVFLIVHEHELNFKDEMDQHTVEEKDNDALLEPESDDNLTATNAEEEEPVIVDEVHRGPDVSVKEDGGHFNKNKDNQPSFSAPEEMQKVPQATLENPFDMGLGVEVEHSSSGWQC